MAKNNAALTRISAAASKYSILVVLAIVFVISCILNRNFLSLVNLTNILRQNAVVVILAFGETMLIIYGMIDLSSGAVIAFTGCLLIASGIFSCHEEETSSQTIEKIQFAESKKEMTVGERAAVKLTVTPQAAR